MEQQGRGPSGGAVRASLLVIAAAVYGVFLLLNPTRTASDRLRDMRGEPEETADVDLLIQDMRAAIAEADAFLATIGGSDS